MKIGLICPYNMARGGAVQEIVRDMKIGLTARGHDVKIITGRPRDMEDLDPSDTLFVGKVTDFRAPTHTLASFARNMNAESTARAIEAENFDILHFHEPGLPLLGKQILECSDSVNIATFHAKLPETLMSRTIATVAVPYLRSILKDIHEFTVGSDAAADFVKTLTDRELHHISNGVDLETFRPVPRVKPGPRKKILYIGRLEHRKGVKYLLQAYQLLTKDSDEYELIIAGSGPNRRRLEQLSQTMNIPNVTFMGYVDHATKLKLLAEADLFCAPAIFGESFGLVLLEAMATGLVTVAGNNPGYSDVLKGFGSLSIVDPYDAPDFARRLKLFLEQEELRTMWRKWALKTVKQYDYNDIIDQYELLYEQALRSHGRTAAATA